MAEESHKVDASKVGADISNIDSYKKTRSKLLIDSLDKSRFQGPSKVSCTKLDHPTLTGGAAGH